MKILMIAPEPFFEPRGTPISVYQRLQALAAMGHTIDLLTYHVGQDVRIPGVSIYRTPRLPFIKHVKIGPSWPKLVLDVFLMCQALARLVKRRYDVLHSHEEAAFFAAPLAKLFHARHLYDMHSLLSRQLANFNVGNHWPIPALFRILERWTIRSCDALITIGPDLEAIARAINPALKQIQIQNLPVQAIPGNGAPPSGAELRHSLGLADRRLVVYTGTFERYQGLDILLDSAQIVRRNDPRVTYVLVGGSPNRVMYWKNQARQRQLDDCILFVGAVSPSEAARYLDMAELVVSPRVDGTSVPLKIYSYLQAGKAILATKLEAHTQVLTSDTALLVEPTGESLAAGIIRLMQNEELRAGLGDRARRYADEALSFSNYMAKLRWIYQTLEAPKTS